MPHGIVSCGTIAPGTTVLGWMCTVALRRSSSWKNSSNSGLPGYWLPKLDMICTPSSFNTSSAYSSSCSAPCVSGSGMAAKAPKVVRIVLHDARHELVGMPRPMHRGGAIAPVRAGHHGADDLRDAVARHRFAREVEIPFGDLRAAGPRRTLLGQVRDELGRKEVVVDVDALLVHCCSSSPAGRGGPWVVRGVTNRMRRRASGLRNPDRRDAGRRRSRSRAGDTSTNTSPQRIA